MAASRSTSSASVGVCTRPTFSVTPYKQEKSRVALIPTIAFVLVGANQNFPFGGTSILIMVGVGLDTVKRIESQLQQRRYEGFLR